MCRILILIFDIINKRIVLIWNFNKFGKTFSRCNNIFLSNSMRQECDTMTHIDTMIEHHHTILNV